MGYQVDPVIQQLKKAFEMQRTVKILELRESLLPNWGGWIYRESIRFIDVATGAIKTSFSGRILDYAPCPDKSGYHYDHPVPHDAELARDTHGLIQRLPDNYRNAIYGRYVYHDTGLDDMQRKRLQRAMQALADLMPDY